MNSSQEKTGRKPLQGPRPAPLRVSRESHQVRKPPLPNQYRPPVIIYAHSPEIIHTNVGEFKNLVQRLIGQSASNPDLYSQPPPAPAPAASAGMVFEASHSPYLNNFRVLNSDLSPFSFPQKESESFSGNDSPVSPNIPSNLFSPLSPNLFLPSPRLLSPDLFKDLPLFTPQLQSGYSDHFFSPGHVFHKQSELLFTPPPSVRPFMNLNALWSPSPTSFDLFNNRP